MFNTKSFYILIILSFFLSKNLTAQSSNNYSIQGYSFNQGGGLLQSPNFQSQSGVGQSSITGENRSENYQSASGFLQVNHILTDVSEGMETIIPNEFKLFQNFPNPFNLTTTIQFQVPKPSKVTIKIFDILGREIRELVNKDFEPGWHNITFDSNDNFGMEIASGVYFYRMITNDYVEVKKILLLK